MHDTREGISHILFQPIARANLRRYAPPPSRGRRENAASQAPHEEGLRYENAAFLALSFRAKARNLFRSRSSKKREESGKRETRYSKRVGITVLHVDSITKEKGNGKRKRSLGCARDDETREGYFPFLFIPLRKPTSAPSGHLLPEEGGRYENAVFLVSSFRAEARPLFRSRSIRKSEDSG